jgi:ribose transport system ATP-binding protein
VPLLHAEAVSKSYPGVKALSGVDLEVEAGEVHALLGENGAGKSTLMKVIAGAVEPDQGRITIDGKTLRLGSPELARRDGVAIVYQELSLVPTLSVAENIVLGRWPVSWWGTIDWRSIHEHAAENLARIGLDIDPKATIADLGMADRQLVEVAKALSESANILLLDEPTSALSEHESRRLFDIVRDLKDSGVGIVYVSHRLAEVLEVADRITVLRDGEEIDTVDAGDVVESDLAQMMVGRRVDLLAGTRVERHGHRKEEILLRAEGLACAPRLKRLDLEIRGGEVVGVFGLVGAGRTRLARTLFGLEPATEGKLELLGRPVTISSPADAIAAGLGFLAEDRSMGVVPRMTVVENITLASLDQIGTGLVIDFSRERRLARRYAQSLDIRTPSLDRLVETLSGGNQQKVVLARWLCSNSRVLILDDPTRGIDVGAKEEVFRLVRGLASEGMGILYLTSEIREARALADRLLIMADGRIVRSVDPASSEDEILAAAGGSHG